MAFFGSELIREFTDLVRIDSPSGHEDRIAEFIIGRLSGHASSVRRDSYGNVYASIDGIGEPLFFSAHMDTVEPGRGINPIVGDDAVTSDGATVLGADNKAPLAVMLQLLHALPGTPHVPLEFIFTRSEEVGNYGAVNFDYRLLKSTAGFCFDSATPLGTILTASPYYDRFDLRIVGRTAHVKTPHAGINVLPVFAHFLQNTRLGAVDEQTLVNIGTGRFGSVRNAIPGEMEICGEVRSFSPRRMEFYGNEIRNTISDSTARYGARFDLDVVRENPGYVHNSREALTLIARAETAVRATGLTPARQQSWGVSDANIFNDRHGLFCVNMGYGAEGTHSNEESILIDDLEKLHALMLELARAEA
jgi:tripeptide aminopeptidase